MEDSGDGDGDGEVGGASATGAVGGDDHVYQVVGTLQEDHSVKPTWVGDIIPVGSIAYARALLLECILNKHELHTLLHRK